MTWSTALTLLSRRTLPPTWVWNEYPALRPSTNSLRMDSSPREHVTVAAPVAASRSESTAVRTLPHDPDLADLDERYRRLHAARGNDLQAGLHLAEWLGQAGLEVLEFRGTYQIIQPPPGVRAPS